MISFPDDFPLMHKDASHQWVGTDCSFSSFGEIKCTLHKKGGIHGVKFSSILVILRKQGFAMIHSDWIKNKNLWHSGGFFASDTRNF
jgi:hypothetical protein